MNKHSRLWIRAAALALAALLSSHAAHAQVPRPNPPAIGPAPIELGAGLTFETPQDLNLPPLCNTRGLSCLSPRTVPDLGVGASLSARVTTKLQAVGEGSISRDIIGACPPGSGVNIAPCLAQQANDVRSVLVGARVGPFSPWAGHRPDAQLFVQVLGGRRSSNLDARPMVQPGGGVDLTFTNGVRVRAEIDYCAVLDSRSLSTARTVVWLAVPL